MVPSAAGLRLSEWNSLVQPPVRAAFRAAWSPERAPGAADLAPYLDVLQDPSVPGVARRIAAAALLPRLHDPTGAVAERLAEWLQGLPPDRLEGTLQPILLAATRLAAASPAPETGAATRGEAVRLWVAVASELVARLPAAMVELVARLLARLQPWPLEARADARRLCAVLAEHLVVRPSTVEGVLSSDPFAILVQAWANGLEGSDPTERAEFEKHMATASDEALGELAESLLQVQEVDGPLAVRLWRELVARFATEGAHPHLAMVPIQEIFTRLIEREGIPALVALLDGYRDVMDRHAEANPQPPAFLRDEDRFEITFGPAEDPPEGPARTFRMADHPHFRAPVPRDQAAEFRPGPAGLPQLVFEIGAEWVRLGRPDLLREAMRAMLRRNVVSGFWPCSLYWMTNHPRIVALDGLPLLKDAGILRGELFGALSAVRACLPHVSDRARDAIEQAVLMLYPEDEASRLRFRAWYARALAEAGVPGRPADPELQAALADPPHEPHVPQPVPLADPTSPPTWGPIGLGPRMDDMSSRYGVPLGKLWRFGSASPPLPLTPESAREAMAMIFDVGPRYVRSPEKQHRDIVWKALRAALAAPAGTFTPEELDRVARELAPWSCGHDTPAELNATADVLEALLRLLPPDRQAVAWSVLRDMFASADPRVRILACRVLGSTSFDPESVHAGLWIQAVPRVARAGQSVALQPLLAALLRIPKPLPGAVDETVRPVLEHAGKWHRRREPPPEGVVLVGPGFDPEAWEGDEVAMTLGGLLARMALEGRTEAERRFGEFLRNADDSDGRLGLLATQGAAAWISAPARTPARQGAPQQAGGTEARVGLEDLCRRLFPASGVAALARRWLELADRQPGSPAGVRRASLFREAAFVVLTPTWRSGNAHSGEVATDLLQCAAMLLDVPPFAERIWREWLY